MNNEININIEELLSKISNLDSETKMMIFKALYNDLKKDEKIKFSSFHRIVPGSYVPPREVHPISNLSDVL